MDGKTTITTEFQVGKGIILDFNKTKSTYAPPCTIHLHLYFPFSHLPRIIPTCLCPLNHSSGIWTIDLNMFNLLVMNWPVVVINKSTR